LNSPKEAFFPADPTELTAFDIADAVAAAIEAIREEVVEVASGSFPASELNDILDITRLIGVSARGLDRLSLAP
jgi:hypothetical protein